MNSNNRMVINTVVMYVRLAITMVITLLSSRWVLLALGEEDFGIYNLVAGLLGLLMFLNLSMSTASQRFMSFALGKKDDELLNETFYICTILHFVVGLIIVLLVEAIGQILLSNFLQVPEGKEALALFCLHSLSINTFFTVISVPFRAALISHENIVFVAIIEVGAAVLKLISAIVLLSFDGSRLRLYAVLMTIIPIIQTICFRLYTKSHYKESRFALHQVKDKNLFKDMLSYAGWNMIGSVSSLLRDQGIPMLLNSFYGVIMNTAYGIAIQVKGQLNYFSTSIVTATKPQIVKSEGSGNRSRSLSLSCFTSKVTFLLLSMIAIPLIVEMPYVLEIWLKIVPEYTVNFTRLVIVICLVYQFSIGLSIPIEAIGRIKLIQIILGGLHMLVIPVAYVMLRLSCSPESVLVMIIIEELTCIVAGLFISKNITGQSIKGFVINTLLPSVIAASVLLVFEIVLQKSINYGFARLCVMCALSLIYIPLIGYVFVFTKSEKEKSISIIKQLISKIK